MCIYGCSPKKNLTVTVTKLLKTHTHTPRYGRLPSVDESIHLFNSNPEPFHLEVIKLTERNTVEHV